MKVIINLSAFLCAKIECIKIDQGEREKELVGESEEVQIKYLSTVTKDLYSAPLTCDMY